MEVGEFKGPVIESYDPGMARVSFKDRFRLLSPSQKAFIVIVLAIFAIICLCITYYAMTMIFTRKGWI